MSQKIDPFVNFHVHCDAGSLLDGFSTIPEYLKEADRIGQPALAITDHGSLAGLYDLQKYSTNPGYQVTDKVKGIAGIEFYVVPSTGDIHTKEPLFLGDGGRDDISGNGAYTHLTVIAENNVGLKNLFYLSEVANKYGYYRKPRISLEYLEEYSEGLIATTGCPSGEIQVELRLGHYDKALAYAARLQDIFGKNNVFVELMDHGMKQDLERKVRGGLLSIAKALNMPLLATNDAHYAKAENVKSHEEMLAIQSGSSMNELADYDGGKRFAFEGGSYYLATAAEMLAKFPENPEAISNSLLIAERASFSIEKDEDLLPTIEPPAGYTEEEWFRKQVLDGLAERLPDKRHDPVYLDRIEHELKVILPKNFASYFLVVSDFMKWARFEAQPPVPTGFGRGSGAGSLCAFALYITDPDPIRWNLLFERFVHTERDNFPDFDTDFGPTDRARVIEYVRNKYGEDKVGGVVTFGTIKAKAAIKDVVRIYERGFDVGNKLTKALPPAVFGKEISLADVYNPGSKRYDEAGEFRNLVEREGYQGIIDSAIKLEGRVRNLGQHAAAVLISSKPLNETIPMRRVNSKVETLVTEWDFPTSEAIGLLKVDFLGLRNLEIVRDALALIKMRKGIEIDIQDIIHGSLDDPKVYELLTKGDTLGVFQLDSGGIRSLQKVLKPTEFNDISALLALYRPGPMGINAHLAYANRKNGLEETDYIHPDLEETLKPILGDTYGIAMYQEQIMQIAQAVSGYTLAQADNLRRAMGKKKIEVLQKEYIPFRDGAKANGFSDEVIKDLWDVLVPFADYGFNKSHSIAYGLLSYVTAWLKAHYAADYMAALLSSVSDDTNKTAAYLEDCRKRGIKVTVPNINKSLSDYTPISDTEISYGFKAMSGVGDKVSDAIVACRDEGGEFESYADFLLRAPKEATNKRVVVALAQGGAFDCVGITRRTVMENHEENLKVLAKIRRSALKAKESSGSLFDLFDSMSLDEGESKSVADNKEAIRVSEFAEYPELEKLKMERKILGLYISSHPLQGLDLSRVSSVKVADLLPTGDENEEPPVIAPLEGWAPKDAKPLKIAGIVTTLSLKRTKKGDSMAVGVFEDMSGAIEFTLFPKMFEIFGEFLKLDGVYQLSGFSRARDGEDVTFNVDALRPLDFADSGKLSVRVKVTKKQWVAGRETLLKHLERHMSDGIGTTNVIVSVKDENDDIWEETLPFTVKTSSALTSEIRELFGMLAIGRWRKPI
jgi:DNA polymerase-3 subunit alpha